MVADNEVTETMVTDGMVGALQTQIWAIEGHAEFTVKERRTVLFEK